MRSVFKRGSMVLWISRVVTVSAVALLVGALGQYSNSGTTAQSSPKVLAAAAQKPADKAPAQAGTAQTTTTANEAAAPKAQAATQTTSAYSPSCQVANYALPANINVADYPVGANKINEGATYYAVSAQAASTLASEVHSCAKQQPSLGDYDAVTGHNMAWSYAYANLGGGQCKVANVRVVMRVNQLLPALTENSNASARQAWAQTSSALYAHENEHVAINFANADGMYNELSATTGNCATIAAQANAIVKKFSDAITAENTHLDDVTAHGTR